MAPGPTSGRRITPYYRRMARPGITIPALARLRASREVVRSWRALTGGSGVRDAQRRTLLACSGGGDSSALVLALASRRGHVVVGHVVHDMRPEAASLADRDHAAALADACGLEFVQARVRVRASRGNQEAAGRAARYAALERLALDAGCRFVATAHQADDVLETLLMRLVRGAGPAGLRGPLPARPLGRVTLIRPMLGLSGEEARAICAAAGWAWTNDSTNADTSRLRAFVRTRLTPAIREIDPRAATRAVRTAAVLGEVAEVIDALARTLLDQATPTQAGIQWDRNTLADAPGVVVAEALRLGALRVAGERGADRRGGVVLRPVSECIRGRVHNRKVFEFGGVRIEVRGASVVLGPAPASPTGTS